MIGLLRDEFVVGPSHVRVVSTIVEACADAADIDETSEKQARANSVELRQTAGYIAGRHDAAALIRFAVDEAEKEAERG